MTKHITVLKKETVDLVKTKSDGVYIDLTLGGGGHSLDILSNLTNGHLIVVDIDQNAIDNFVDLLLEEGAKEVTNNGSPIKKFNFKSNEVVVVNTNFENITDIVKQLGFEKLDGVIADLGWSTDQLDKVPGLSFENESEELDMRFDKSLNVTAADFLNALGKKELKIMFERYSDFFGVQNKTLIEELINYRKRNKFITVGDLNEFITFLGFNYVFKTANKNQLKARIFQALRIAVNDEYNNLKTMITSVVNVLNNKSRFAIITFHSGEEKIVEEFFTNLVNTKKATWVSDSKNKLYIQPSLSELKENISSRSSKLWAIEIN